VKRLWWFGVGAAAGATSTLYGLARLRQSAARPAAERLAGAAGTVGGAVGTVVGGTARLGAAGARRFIDDARDQIRQVESELGVEPDGPPSGRR
jgi:hypothetical protein